MRYQHLSAEIDALDRLVAAAAPALVAIKGVGTDIASTLLTIAGDNPERLTSEGAFAHLVGVAPIEASSGKITRYRLNRGGDRQGNRALYLLAVGRMGWDPATRTYVARRTGEGRTKPEIIRCLKRYIARELYTVLLAMTPDARPGRTSTSSLRLPVCSWKLSGSTTTSSGLSETSKLADPTGTNASK
jgi:transposase